MSARQKLELVIFDCDGVLIDSEGISVRAQTQALNAAGFGISAHQLAQRFTGVADAEMYRIIEAEFGRELPGDHDVVVRDTIRLAYDRELTPIPGVAAAIDALTCPICVASSATPDKLQHGLRVTQLLDLFAPNIFSASMVARGKPAPDLFLLAAQKMKANPSATVVVEDSVAGVTAGVSAGMVGIGFCGGSHTDATTAGRLEDAGANCVISDMARLTAAIEACRG